MNVILRKIGNSVGVIIPKEMLDQFGLKEGHELKLEAQDGGMMFRATDEEFAKQIELGRQFMDQYKVALQKLAE